jgi:anti-sigma regulatory factor (Ser/Thr protein kinase)
MPTEPVTVPDNVCLPAGALAGREMDFPYPARALGISFLTLAAVPAAVGHSRELVRLGLDRWGLASLAADAEMVVSELATNAIQATGLTNTDATWNDVGDAVAAFHVRLLLFEASIVIEVWDGNPAAPVPQDVTGEDEGGRGLLIVAMLSTRWDWFAAPHGGKVVSAECAIPPRPLTEAGLPQRSRPGTVIRENRAGVIRDPVLMRRIHQALKNL